MQSGNPELCNKMDGTEFNSINFVLLAAICLHKHSVAEIVSKFQVSRLKGIVNMYILKVGRDLQVRYFSYIASCATGFQV